MSDEEVRNCVHSFQTKTTKQTLNGFVFTLPEVKSERGAKVSLKKTTNSLSHICLIGSHEREDRNS